MHYSQNNLVEIKDKIKSKIKDLQISEYNPKIIAVSKTFPEQDIDDHYLFVSRDLPRNDRRDDGTYWAWTNQPTTFTSDMHRGYVVADGWDETHFTRGATISVSLNGPTLKLLTFRSTIYDRVAYWIDA